VATSETVAMPTLASNFFLLINISFLFIFLGG
jgi:hypothetical protein